MSTVNRSPLTRRLLAGAAALAAAAVGVGTLTATAPASATTTVLDPLTGVRVRALGPLVAVKVANTNTPNKPSAAPQSGLRSADQVWVEEQEGGWTRFIAIYGAGYPAKVGPVRSARETDLGVLPQFGKVGLVYAGADTPVLNLVKSDPLLANVGEDAVVNGVAVRPTGYFVDRARKAPYNFYAKSNVLKNFAKAAGATAPRPMGFSFGKPKVRGTTTRSLGIVWASQTAMTAVWNAKLHAWVMYWKVGRKLQMLVDRETKRAVTATNIVVMRVAYSISKLDRSQYRVPVLKTVGRGAAMVLRDGARWSGTWTRTSLTRGTALRDSRGRVMTLAPGQTWVFLVPYGKSLNKPYVLHSVSVR